MASVTVGQRHGRLTVTAEAERYRSPGGQNQRRVVCQCECGQVVTVRTSSLSSGLTTSCGCAQRESTARSNRARAVHGMEGTPTYKAWSNMKGRCTNPKHHAYHDYGGRGIRVCNEWMTFTGFFKDMGKRPSNHHSLERIDNNGDYEPGNVKWATTMEQNANRRSSVMLTMDGETHCLAEWSRRTGLREDTIRWRIKNGFTIEDALTLPPRGKQCHGR